MHRGQRCQNHRALSITCHLCYHQQILYYLAIYNLARGVCLHSMGNGPLGPYTGSSSGISTSSIVSRNTLEDFFPISFRHLGQPYTLSTLLHRGERGLNVPLDIRRCTGNLASFRGTNGPFQQVRRQHRLPLRRLVCLFPSGSCLIRGLKSLGKYLGLVIRILAEG